MEQEFNKKHSQGGMANNFLYLQFYGIQGSLQGSGTVRGTHPINGHMQAKKS